MRLSEESEAIHASESATSSSANAAISATPPRAAASAPVAIGASSTTALANAAFAVSGESVSSASAAAAGRRQRTRTSPVASHLLQAHGSASAMRLAPAPNLMFRGDATLFASAAEVGARRRDLSHILSNENLRKLAVAYEQLGDATDTLQFSLSDVARSLPPPATAAAPRRNVAATSGRASASGPIVIGSAPSDLSAGFASFDDDDDDDDDDDNDNDRVRRSASGSAPVVSFEATREELECSLCFRLFYQPMTSHCGHSFCAPCYHELVRHSNTCALCREPFASTPPNVNVALRGVCAAAFPEEFLARSEEGRREEDELARARSAELARANDASRDRGGGINARANDDENDEGGINLMGLQGVFCLSLSSLLCSHDEPRRRHQNNNNNVNNANVNNNNNNNVNNGGHNNNHADEGEGLVEDQS